MMKKKIIIALLISISISLTLQSQNFEGIVGEYPDRYDMSEFESYARITANGGFEYDRKGFLVFKPNSIVFGVGKLNQNEEVYMELNFAYDTFKNASVSSGIFNIVPTFIMIKDKEKINQVKIEYFTYEPFIGREGGLFVISLDNKMYLLQVDEDVLSSVADLYKD